MLVVFLPRGACAPHVYSAVYAMTRCLSVCLSVCLSKAGIVSKMLNGSSWFSAQILPSAYPIHCV